MPSANRMTTPVAINEAEVEGRYLEHEPTEAEQYATHC